MSKKEKKGSHIRRSSKEEKPDESSAQSAAAVVDLVAGAVSSDVELSDLEKKFVEELAKLRASPAEYANVLKKEVCLDLFLSVCFVLFCFVLFFFKKKPQLSKNSKQLFSVLANIAMTIL